MLRIGLVSASIGAVQAWSPWGGGPGAAGDVRGTIQRFGTVSTGAATMASRTFVEFGSDLEFNAGQDGLCAGSQSGRRFLLPQEEEKEMLSILELAFSMDRRIYINIFSNGCVDGYNVLRNPTMMKE